MPETEIKIEADKLSIPLEALARLSATDFDTVWNAIGLVVRTKEPKVEVWHDDPARD